MTRDGKGTKGNLYTLWKLKYYSHCRRLSKTWKLKHHGRALPLLDTNQEAQTSIQEWYLRSAASRLLLRIATIWRQSWYLPKSQLINKMYLKHKMGYHLAVRNKELNPVFAWGCSQVEDVWEVRQAKPRMSKTTYPTHSWSPSGNFIREMRNTDHPQWCQVTGIK